MSATFEVGHTDTLSIVYLDQNGNPMSATVTPDSPPTWSQSTPTTDTLTPSSDGLTATAKALAAGTDAITLTVIVGGVTFTATDDLTITAPPQVLTTVQIADSVA